LYHYVFIIIVFVFEFDVMMTEHYIDQLSSYRHRDVKR